MWIGSRGQTLRVAGSIFLTRNNEGGDSAVAVNYVARNNIRVHPVIDRYKTLLGDIVVSCLVPVECFKECLRKCV